MKKIFLILTLVILSFWSWEVFAVDNYSLDPWKFEMKKPDLWSSIDTKLDSLDNIKTASDEKIAKQNRITEMNTKCEWKWWSNTDWTACTIDDITNSNFQFDTSFLRIKEWTQTWATSTEKLNYWIWTLIEKLMIWLSILALVLMTIWAWFMITSMWDDQKLSTWKNILKAWIMWLVIALMAYPIMSIVRFILYKWN